MVDRVRQEFIREGRDPDWRLAWEEHLRPEQRRLIEDSVKSGMAVADPLLRVHAVGLANRRLRICKWLLALMPLHLGAVAGWIYFTCVVADPPQFWCWIYGAIGVLWLIAVPMRVARQRERLIVALRMNESGAPD